MLLREVIADPFRRIDLLRLADGLFCHSEDPDRVVEFLAEKFDRGQLVAVRLPNPYARMRPILDRYSALLEVPWDDIPYLKDLQPRTQDAGDASDVATQEAVENAGVEDDAIGPTWFEIEVTGEAGLVVDDARLTVRLPDGETQTHSLGVPGRVRIESISRPGACEAWLDVPVMLSAPAYPPGELPPFDALIAHDQPTAVSLVTGRLQRVAVRRPAAHIVELSDVAFESDGRILRPAARGDAGGGAPRSGGLSGVAAALALAFAQPERCVVVVGHSDTVGSAADNDILSLERATNVQCFMAGQRNDWAAHCQAHYTVGDFEAAYRFVAHTFDWDCDPGKVDDDFDEASRSARDRFRQRYTAETGTVLERHVKQSHADWAAVFDLYRRALAQTMDLDLDTLAVRCAALGFVDPANVGCGERFPKQAPDRDGFASGGNRRVDIVLVRPSDLPYLGSPVDVERLYGAARVFRRIGVYVPREGEALGEFVSQLVDELDEPVPHQRYELTLPDGTMLEGRLDAEGFFRVHGVPVGICKLVYPDLDAREWGAPPIGPRALPARDPDAAAPQSDADDGAHDDPGDDEPDDHEHQHEHGGEGEDDFDDGGEIQPDDDEPHEGGA